MRVRLGLGLGLGLVAWWLEEIVGCCVVAAVAEQAREERDAEDAWSGSVIGLGLGSGLKLVLGLETQKMPIVSQKKRMISMLLPRSRTWLGVG